MGIRLDWEIESERERLQSVGEDPEAAKRRRRALRRIILFTVLLVIIGASIVGLVMLRLQQVDEIFRQNLLDTVENEVAAVRIGDRSGFTNIQRSDSESWLQSQQQLYDDYQALKQQPNLVLSGRVLDTQIDGPRGRVLVEEIINGAQYARVWFYWRFDDGWRHVPPDYTFWGDERMLENDQLAIRYWSVDEPFAQELAASLPAWLNAGCQALNCAQIPQLVVNILPDESVQPGWLPDEPWHMRIASPFLQPVRMDAIWQPENRLAVAGLLAEQLTTTVSNGLEPIYPADAYYLRQVIASWLTKRFSGVEINTYSIDTLTARYGDDVVGRLLAQMTPEANVAVMAQAAGVPSIADLEIDWRDFLTWRLTLEQELIAARDDTHFLALYDLNDIAVRDAAFSRFEEAARGTRLLVSDVTRGVDEVGNPALFARTIVLGTDGSTREEQVVFRLVDGTWKRAS
ncbi:MAG: hypothetical protein IT320_17160 [Anaerolineae bacterium]|nr:hypothetical protein [Anaerolineae bacterium]